MPEVLQLDANGWMTNSHETARHLQQRLCGLHGELQP
jgi:hypothetical protein